MSTVNITKVIQDGKLNKFHIALLAVCCLIIVFDMFDLVVYASVLPLLMNEWGISAIEAGVIGSYGPLGMMIGAFIFGIFADKFGKKNGLMVSVFLFSIFTFLCAFAPGSTMFGICRLIAGIGIGGILPNVIAMLSDYAPEGKANKFISIVMVCFPVGALIAAVAGIYIIPVLGWQGIYLLTIAPIILIPFIYKYLHDSPIVLLAKGKKKELCVALHKANPTVTCTPDMNFVVDTEEEVHSSPIVSLFKDKRALGTVMIWVVFFMCLLMINGLNTWLPKIMFSAGYALNSSLGFLVALNIGAIIGTLVLGNLADKYGAKKVLVPMYIMSAVSLILLMFKADMWLLYSFIMIAGACTTGAQNITYGFTSLYYPSAMRSTAIGFASGVGRIGAIIGPTFGGILVELQLSTSMNFLAFAIPGIIAAIACMLVPLHNKRKETNETNETFVGKLEEVN